jgi:hypothetical protein
MSEPTSAQISEFMDGLRRGTVSAEALAAAMTGSTKDIKESSSKMIGTFTTGAGQIFGGVTSFTKSMANGAQGASAFSGIITATTTGLGTMLGKFNVAGEAISKMAKFGEGYVVQALKQSDDLFTAFQGLSKVGGASEEGMQGVFDNMQKFGMTMNQMPQFGAMIAQNSEALAKLGGSVSQGTKTFADVAAGIQQSGLQAQFERMGLTIQAQNEGTANYLKLQTLTGASSKKSNEELTAGAAEYIRQQDRLSKLTGKSADTLAKEEEARMSDQRYRALSREMQQKADAAKAAGDIEGAKVIEAQMAANRELLANTPKELQKGVQDLMSGVVNSPEAKAMYTSLPEMAQTIMGQNFNASEVITAGAKEVSGFLDRNTALAKAGLSNQVNIDFAGAANLEAKNRVKTAAENDKAAKEEQDKLAAGTNVDINNQVAMREAQRATTTSMENLVNKGVGPLTEGMRALSTGLAKTVDAFPGTKNKELPDQNKLNRNATAAEVTEAKRVNPGMSNEEVKKLADTQAKRGEYAPATAKYKAELPDITTEDLKKAWQDFLDNAIFDTDKKTDDEKKKDAEIQKKLPKNTPDNRPNFGKNPAESAVRQAPADNGKPADRKAPADDVKPADRKAPTEDNRPNFRQRPEAVSRGAGPAYRDPGVLEDNRPENQTAAKSAAEQSTSELATVFIDGIKTLSRQQSEQTASIDELVELMRRSVGVQGKILQTSRA